MVHGLSLEHTLTPHPDATQPKPLHPSNLQGRSLKEHDAIHHLMLKTKPRGGRFRGCDASERSHTLPSR